MDWLTLAQLIIKVGIPSAHAIWSKWKAKGEPTEQDWIELKAMSAQTSAALLEQALINNGVDLNSPKAKELLALVKG